MKTNFEMWPGFRVSPRDESREVKATVKTFFNQPVERPKSEPLKRDRKAYFQECELRWSGIALRDARSNWALFQEHHDDIMGILQPYLKDPLCEDLANKQHNPEGTLTSWLWKCSEAHRWISDFCNHYQNFHLRRGIIIYCKQVIGELEHPLEDCVFAPEPLGGGEGAQ